MKVVDTEELVAVMREDKQKSLPKLLNQERDTEEQCSGREIAVVDSHIIYRDVVQ